MNVIEINTIFKTVFNKNLHIHLMLSDQKTYTKEFLEEYKTRYFGKEIPITNLKETIFDTKRWEFDSDLTVVLYSVPVFNQEKSQFETDVIAFADIEDKVKHYSATTLLNLMKFVDPKVRNNYFEYIRELKKEWRR